VTTLNSPTEGDLSSGLVVFFSWTTDGLVQEASILLGGHAQLQVTQVTEAAECHNVNTSLLNPATAVSLGQEWVQLDLEDSGLNSSVFEDIRDLKHTNVGDTNVSAKLLINSVFHGVPCLFVSNIVVNNHGFVIRVLPSSWVLLLKRNKLQGNGEVDQEQIQVITLKVLNASLCCKLNLVDLVVSVPEL
jgi:hypothetical protein